MSRSRIVVQGALACALMLAGITTVFVRSGDDDVAAPAKPSPTTVTSPLPSFDETPSARPAPKPEPRATVRPSAPLTKQEAEPIGVYEIWRPDERTPPKLDPPAPRPVTCQILSQVRKTVDGTLITPDEAKARDLTCVRSATLVRVYRDPLDASLL